MYFKQILEIKLTREEKDILDEAQHIISGIYLILNANKENGSIKYQEGLNIYDPFWHIYHTCLKIDMGGLIPTVEKKEVET